MSKLYIIAYDTQAGFDAMAFANYIKALSEKKWISDWWHYVNTVYIVASERSAQELYNAAAPGMKGIRHVLVIEIDPKNEQGWLPPDAWKWLQKYK